jgi:hypothetical protein
MILSDFREISGLRSANEIYTTGTCSAPTSPFVVNPSDRSTDLDSELATPNQPEPLGPKELLGD